MTKWPPSGISWYYSDPQVALALGDSKEILPLLQGTEIDILHTSPPYNVGIKYAGGFNDNRPLEEFQLWIKELFTVIYSRMKDHSRSYIFLGDKMQWWCKPMFEEIGWKYHETLIWCKPNMPMTRAGRITGDWNVATESILLLHKGKKTKMLKSEKSKTWNWIISTTPSASFNKNKRMHPAQFPEELVIKLLCRTPGELILDPFLGSGTTAVCAKKLGRKAIGIDISEEYLEIAAKRCAQTPSPIPGELIKNTQLTLGV